MADQEFNSLTDKAIAQLRADHNQLRNMVRNLLQARGHAPGGYAGPLFIGTATEDIAAYSAGAPGSGEVSISRWSDDGTTIADDASWTETAYNRMTSAVTSGAGVFMLRDLWGRLWIISEDCGA